MILLLFIGLGLSLTAQAQSVKVPPGIFNSVFQDQNEGAVNVGPLYVDPTPVTNADYLEFLKSNPQWQKSRITPLFATTSYLASWPEDLKFSPGTARFPVVEVSWFAARAYCKSKNARLPTTAEWEYFSDAQSPNYEAEALKWYSKAQQKLRPVGQDKPNRFGLKDTGGLIWEWVEDFASVIMPGDSREGPMKDLFCAGASLQSKDPSQYASFIRYAMRSSLKGKYTGTSLGFRCVKDMSGVQK